MRDGKLIAEGTYHELKKRVPGSRKLIIETNMENTASIAKTINDEYKLKTVSHKFKLEIFYDDESLIDNLLTLIRKNTKIFSIQTLEPSLEDTFIFFSKNDEVRTFK